jgi:hypothetical protein
MLGSGEGFTKANSEPAEVIPVDFRGGRQYRIDIGRVSLLDWHRQLRKNGSDPTLRTSYERSLAETRKMLDDFEFKQAQQEAYELLLKEED